jgi:hypothetical protein
MNATSIKKALAGVAIVVSSVGAMAAPAFATKNTGGYQRSSEGIKNQYVDPCPGIYNQFEKDVNSAQVAHDNGQTNSMLGFLDLASEDLKAGQMAGCDWAAEMRVPTLTTPGAVTAVHPVRAAR